VGEKNTKVIKIEALITKIELLTTIDSIEAQLWQALKDYNHVAALSILNRVVMNPTNRTSDISQNLMFSYQKDVYNE
jgi:predicted DNA binding CopG/RHH family protein